MSKESFCPRWKNTQIVMCLAYLFWYISLDYSIMFFFKSIMPNIKHNIKIICEIHIAYRYIDPSNRHNFENCLLPWYLHQSCLGWPLTAWLAQAALREKSWKDNFQSYGLTIQSIWFSLKNPYDFFKNSYGFLLKIHKDFSEIFRFFYKNHNKEKNR